MKINAGKSIYLAGPMSGYPAYNFEEFHRVTKILREYGYTVFSPAEKDLADGFDPYNDPQHSFLHYMKIDLPEVMNSDAVVLLEGWNESKGAKLEVSVATQCDIPVFLFNEKFDDDERDIDWNLIEINFKSNTTVAAEGEVRMVDPKTGGEKGSKPARFDLLPSEALWKVAEIYGKGAEKYAVHNWRRGYNWSLSFAALQRHDWQFWGGENIDKETGCEHMACVAFHALSLLTFAQEHKELDDRFKKP